jgi:putative addiction module component (TIGR02574 family)
MKISEIPEIAKLSKPEKILLVEDLWENISADDSDIPVPDSHKKELDKRLERYKKSPGKILTLKDLQINIEMRK